MEQPGSYFLELRNHFFGVKILKFFYADPGSGMRDWDSSDPGSGMGKSWIRDKHPGSATLIFHLTFLDFRCLSRLEFCVPILILYFGETNSDPQYLLLTPCCLVLSVLLFFIPFWSRSRRGQRGGIWAEHHRAEGPQSGEDEETTRAEGREREETEGTG